MRVWIDTDVGTNVDDAVALVCANTHPAVELCGVSTTGERAGERAEIARRFVDGDVPVVAGGDSARVAAVVAAIGEAAPDAVLAIGPLTAIGAAAARGVLPDHVVVMGGAARPVVHRGRTVEVEFNFGADPAAAATLLAHTSGVTIVPLDVTVTAALDGAGVERLRAAAPVLREAVDAFVDHLAGTGVEPEHRTVILHDPIALLAVTADPAVPFECDDVPLMVDERGRLIVGSTNAMHRLVVGMDAAAAVERILTLVDEWRR